MVRMSYVSALQLVRQMAEAGAAEAQRSAQPDKEMNSEKQSQFQRWPDMYGTDPKELIAFANKTYGHTHPEVVEALLKRWHTSPAQPKPTSSPRNPTSGRKTGAPLSLLKR